MFEAYSVAVKLRLVNSVTPGLLSISQQFTKTYRDASALQRQLDSIKLTISAGRSIAGTGLTGLGLITKAVKPAAEYAHQLAQMRAAGMSNLEVAQATAKAWSAGREVMTSSATENLAAIRELRMVFGDTRHAMENVTTIQKIQGILASSGRGGEDEAYTLAKALEMKGAVRTPAEFAKQADLMSKAIIAGGGKLGAADFQSTFKYGRAATQGWSDQFAYSILPTLIQEMKSSGGSGGGAGGPGNALMSAYSAVVDGTIPQKSLKVWQQLGLLDPQKIVWNKVGTAKVVAPGGVKGSDLFQENPYAWAQTVLLPALKSKGYTSEKAMSEVMQYLFTNRTAGFVMRQMTMQGWKFERDQKLINQASGIKGYDQLVKTDPVLASMALQKKWNDIMVQLGYSIMPELLKVTEKLLPYLSSLADWMEHNRGAVKGLVTGFIALSGALAISGTVWMAVGALKALKITMAAIGVVSGAAGAGGATAGVGGAAAGAGGAAVGAVVKKTLPVAAVIAAYMMLKKIASLPGGVPMGPGGAWIDPKHPEYRNPWDNPKKDGSPYVRPSPKNGEQTKVVLNMDGRKVGEGVMTHLNRSLSAPQAGYSGFDLRMTPLPVGVGGG